MAKSKSYHDYVIADGKLVGDFEGLYQNIEDPWEHATSNLMSSSRAFGIHLLSILKTYYGNQFVLDMGCGKGQYSEQIAALGYDVLGVDISPTAVERGKELVPNVNFAVGGPESFDLMRENKPDVIVLSQISWYILDQIKPFLEFLKTELPDTLVLHMLSIYPPGRQKFGVEYFHDTPSILKYFDMEFWEYAEFTTHDGLGDTVFLGGFDAERAAAWKRKF